MNSEKFLEAIKEFCKTRISEIEGYIDAKTKQFQLGEKEAYGDCLQILCESEINT